MACLRFFLTCRFALEGVPTRTFFCSFKVIAIAVYITVITTNGAMMNKEN